MKSHLHRLGWCFLLCSAVVAGPAVVYAQDADSAAEVVPIDVTDETIDAVAPDGQSSSADETQAETMQEKVDRVFAAANGYIAPVLFFDVTFGAIKSKVTSEDGTQTTETVGVPLLVAVLLLGGVFFTFRYGFVNFRLFGHSIAAISGKYDDPNDHGEVTHFQALTSALSATVGLGNIAGVALAISGGGPGAVFWMWVVAVFGMSAKFSSCTLAQAYRRLSPKRGKKTGEHVLGGPMVYLSEGMKDVFGKAFGTPFGKLLAISFAFFTIMGAIGGGNMFQANQTFEIVSFVMLDGEKEFAWLAGIIMAILVGLVIVGGIRRIGEVTSKIVPAMCVFYCAVCLVILVFNIAQLPGLFGSIFAEAFSIKAAGWGGVIGIMVTGIKRGCFSNEAGLGSAAIAHSAARTNEPVREGAVAMMGPFIDTICVCTMTALVILITKDQITPDMHERINTISAGSYMRGAAQTGAAFETLAGWLPYLLCIAVFVFAYSTMISWCYYGERAAEYLLGDTGIWCFRVVFLSCVVLGPMVSLFNVIGFTDLLILSMAYPNILGMIILSPKVAKMTKDYISRLKAGQFKTYTAK